MYELRNGIHLIASIVIIVTFGASASATVLNCLGSGIDRAAEYVEDLASDPHSAQSMSAKLDQILDRQPYDDVDNDGWTIEQGDCNDGWHYAYPGATQLHCGPMYAGDIPRDNNCNGIADDREPGCLKNAPRFQHVSLPNGDEVIEPIDDREIRKLIEIRERVNKVRGEIEDYSREHGVQYRCLSVNPNTIVGGRAFDNIRHWYSYDVTCTGGFWDGTTIQVYPVD